MVSVAQLAEHRTVAPMVVGSSPIAHPSNCKGLRQKGVTPCLLMAPAGPLTLGHDFLSAHCEPPCSRKENSQFTNGTFIVAKTLIAPEDIAANSAGGTLGYLLARYARFADYLYFRMEYWPCRGNFASDPVTYYWHMKAHLVLKLSGFEATGDSMLKYVDLHPGYFITGEKGRLGKT